MSLIEIATVSLTVLGFAYLVWALLRAEEF
jgi:K+-transporting ATPase KdpF subunit